jgi:Ca-activated chloride channel family protein
MKQRVLALGPGLLLVALCFGQEQPVFRTEVNLITVTVLVRSSDGALITDLGEDDFELFEDGISQRVQFFAREKEVPLNLGLVVDVSGSQDKFLVTVLAPADRAVAICFGNHLRLVSDSTSSSDQIMDGLRRFAKGDHHFPEIGPKEERDLGTALYDALYFTIKEKLKETEECRKAIVLFSDGEENSSEHDLLDTIEEAQNEDTMIYAIRYTGSEQRKQSVIEKYAKRAKKYSSALNSASDLSENEESDGLNARNKYGIRVMKHLAVLTGGSDFDALETNLGDVFTQIGMELHSLYSIGYLSTNPKHDGSFRKLTVECKRPKSVVRAKSGYYAQ